MLHRVELRHPTSPAALIRRYPGALFTASVVATYAYGHFIYSRDWRAASQEGGFSAFSSISPFVLRNDMIVVCVLLILSTLALLPFIQSLERISRISALELPKHALLFMNAYVGFCVFMVIMHFVSFNWQLAQYRAAYPASQTLTYLSWSSQLGFIALPVFIVCTALTLHLKSYGFHHDGLFALIWAIFAIALRFDGAAYGDVWLFGALLVLCAFSLQSWFRELLAYKSKLKQQVLPYED